MWPNSPDVSGALDWGRAPTLCRLNTTAAVLTPPSSLLKPAWEQPLPGISHVTTEVTVNGPPAAVCPLAPGPPRVGSAGTPALPAASSRWPHAVPAGSAGTLKSTDRSGHSLSLCPQQHVLVVTTVGNEHHLALAAPSSFQAPARQPCCRREGGVQASGQNTASLASGCLLTGNPHENGTIPPLFR